MNISILFSIVTLLFTLHATAEETYQVEVDPSVYPKKAFEQKDVKVTNIPARVKRPDALPSRSERESAFSLVPGLDTDIANMDELDRDLLLVRARTKQLKELRKFYPDIEEKKLSILQNVLQKKSGKDTAK